MMIDIAHDFSPYPAGRFDTDGTYNGTAFREEKLLPKLREFFASADPSEKLVIDIDGVRSFGSSFLDEAFGGLMRSGEFSRANILRRMEVRCTKPHLQFYRDEIVGYLSQAEKAA